MLQKLSSGDTLLLYTQRNGSLHKACSASQRSWPMAHWKECIFTAALIATTYWHVSTHLYSTIVSILVIGSIITQRILYTFSTLMGITFRRLTAIVSNSSCQILGYFP